MMAIAHLLEDFAASPAPEGPMQLMSAVALEDQRLAAFEQGYTAGWDDAIAAQARDQSRITGTLARNLEDLSFTYHEALSQMLVSVEPVFRGLVEMILPEMMVHTFGYKIVDELDDMARNLAGQPATIFVSAGAAGALRPLLSRELSMPVEIQEDPSLGEGQAALKIGAAERAMDTEQMLASLRETIDAFFYQNQKDVQNG